MQTVTPLDARNAPNASGWLAAPVNQAEGRLPGAQPAPDDRVSHCLRVDAVFATLD
jgi:hypothetical protein